MKRAIILLIMMLILISFFFISKSITGKAVQAPSYTYTKAICNSTHCQDFEITCENNQARITPITGAIISIDENFKDPRTKQEIEKLC
jgi:hypothetical protein